MSRQLNTTLPTPTQNLTPSPIDHKKFISNRETEQQKQKMNFDRTTYSLPPLDKGDQVKMKKDPQAKWESATVVAKHKTPRSYIVETPEGTVYRRNRKHLCKVKEPASTDTTEPGNIEENPEEITTPITQDTKEEQDQLPPTPVKTNYRLRNPSTPIVPDTLAAPDVPNKPVNTNPRTSRYGRIIKPNPRYMS